MNTPSRRPIRRRIRHGAEVGERGQIHHPLRRADTLCRRTLNRNPPTTGNAPIAPTADGSHPTARAAAPRASQATGAELSAPARACTERKRCAGDHRAGPRWPGPASHMQRDDPGGDNRDLCAQPAEFEKPERTAPRSSGGPARRRREWRAEWRRKDRSGMASKLKSAAAKPLAESRPAKPADEARSAKCRLLSKNSSIEAMSAPTSRK